MAPSKKQLSRDITIPSTLQAEPNKTKIGKVAKTSSSTLRRSSRLAQKISKHPVLCLENGLVNLRNTPESVLSIIERNVASSPLLRLPGEIRNKIFALAMDGFYIHIHESTHSTNEHSRWIRTVGHGQLTLNDKNHQPTAFRLPEVCRQIYSETATLAYKLNSFIIDLDVDGNREVLMAILPAQRDAITSVVPESIFFEIYVTNKPVKPLRTTFPNLKRIEVPSGSLELIISFQRYSDPAKRMWTKEQWSSWVVNEVKEKEGDDVEIVFEDNEE